MNFPTSSCPFTNAATSEETNYKGLNNYIAISCSSTFFILQPNHG